MKESNRYYGKYRGTVFNNIDPEQRGRIMAIVPAVHGLTPTSWALPCVPIAGKQNGVYVVPKIGDGVWIEFEQGDPDYPIWVGGFWGIAAEVPLAALAGNPADPNIVIQSLLQQAVIVSDMPPSVPPPVMPPVPTTGGIILRRRCRLPAALFCAAPRVLISSLTMPVFLSIMAKVRRWSYWDRR